MHINDEAKEDKHQNHPIVERPSLKAIRMWHGYNYQWNQKQMETLADYIEHLEHNLKMTEEALSDAHTRLEAIYERHGEDVEDGQV